MNKINNNKAGKYIGGNSLLVRMEISSSTIEIGMKVPQKMNNKTSL
jgi:hypothetical protein